MCSGVGNKPPGGTGNAGGTPTPGAGAQDRSRTYTPPAPQDNVSKELAALAALLQGKFGTVPAQ